MSSIYLYLFLYPCHRRVAHLYDTGKPVDVIFLNFSKAFGTASQSILLDKCLACSWKTILCNGWAIGSWDRHKGLWWMGWHQAILQSEVGFHGAPSSVLFNIFINTWMQNLKVSLEIMLHWEALLSPLRAERPCRETSTG